MVMVNATDVTGLQHVQPEEVDPFLSLSMVWSYIEYSRRQDNGRASNNFEHTACSRQMDQLEMGQTVMLARGQFARWTMTSRSERCNAVRALLCFFGIFSTTGIWNKKSLYHQTRKN